MEIQKTQIALFCTVDLTGKLALAAELQKASAGRLDVEPLVLPSMPGPPANIPQVIFNTKDEATILQIASRRIDIVFNRSDPPETTIGSQIDKERDFICQIAQTLADSPRITGMATRIGAIFDLASIIPLAESGALRSKFLIPGTPLGNEQMELGFLDREDWADFKINRWLRLKSGPSNTKQSDRILEIKLDFNTQPSESYDFDSALTAKFLDAVKERADDEVKLGYD